jgi:hypothetical protein
LAAAIARWLSFKCRRRRLTDTTKPTGLSPRYSKSRALNASRLCGAIAVAAVEDAALVEPDGLTHTVLADVFDEGFELDPFQQREHSCEASMSTLNQSRGRRP